MFHVAKVDKESIIFRVFYICKKIWTTPVLNLYGLVYTTLHFNRCFNFSIDKLKHMAFLKSFLFIPEYQKIF